MTRYNQGYELERQTRAAFERDGFVVWRPGGSLGEADLVAAKPGPYLVLVQVKRGDARLADDWWNDLYRLAQWLRAIPVIADKPSRGQLRLRRIVALHVPRGRAWPCEPFLLDTIGASGQ